MCIDEPTCLPAGDGLMAGVYSGMMREVVVCGFLQGSWGCGGYCGSFDKCMGSVGWGFVK